MKRLLLFLILLLIVTHVAAQGRIYYVRPDGGSSEDCSGEVDASYSGTNDCAWNHPFQALPPLQSPRIRGGDTLIIARGEYMMGYGAVGTELCEEGGSFDCLMPAIPSGTAEAPTRILGAGWDSGCPSAPILWGTGRPWFILNLSDSSNVEIACLEITDHANCVENHTGGLACERDNPRYGDWASYGLYAEDSSNVHLWNLNIHGLASGGVHAGRLHDWTVDNLRIAGNGIVGWDGDLWDDAGDANTGTLIFRHWLVEWNGCSESYPEGEPLGCWGQEAGGYGDGVGTGETGGDWLIEDLAFLHNSSDGLDLLYHSLGGTVTLNRVRAEGNAGNQIKITGQTSIMNSLLIGNCAFFERQLFTYWVDHCRAAGSTVLIAYTGGEGFSMLNSTVYGQGDGLLGAEPRENFACNDSETFRVRNSIFLGDSDYFDPEDITFLFYQEGCRSLRMDSDYNIVFNVKNIDCGQSGEFTISGSNDLCRDPLLSDFTDGLRLLPNSPAIDSGDNSVCPRDDLLGNPRPLNGICDRGAYE